MRKLKTIALLFFIIFIVSCHNSTYKTVVFFKDGSCDTLLLWNEPYLYNGNLKVALQGTIANDVKYFKVIEKKI